MFFFFFKQKTAYEMRISDWSSDVCSSDLAAPFVEAIDAAKPDTLILDRSADYRFDPSWYYGLPELTRDKWRGEKRISNPGCYATAMQLSIAPLKDQIGTASWRASVGQCV